jgi:hypothetical protein
MHLQKRKNIVKVDISKGWKQYTAWMDQEPDPRRKAMIHNMRLHHKYECLADPAIFDTMVPKPEYVFYMGADPTVLKGMDEVQSFYYGNWEADSSFVDLEVTRCATNDWGAACDGSFYQQVPGSTLIAQGRDIPDPDAFYLAHTCMSWFFPYEDIDGEVKLGGEICYIDTSDQSLIKLDPKDVLTMEEARNNWVDY